MSKALDQARDKFMSYIATMCDDFGLNRFVAQIYAVLYLSDKPLSLDEIAEKLGASKGNVSINIRELVKWGAVKNVWVKGSRKDFYEAELDIKKVISNKLKSSIQRRIASASSMIDEFNSIVQSGQDEMTDEEKHTAKIFSQRLKKIEDLKSLALSALNLADKLL
jgi:DNA-binding transcriptional regulator GbsR (MarR family)